MASANCPTSVEEGRGNRLMIELPASLPRCRQPVTNWSACLPLLPFNPLDQRLLR